MKHWLVPGILAATVILFGLVGMAMPGASKEDTVFQVYPIGQVHKSGGKTYIEIRKQYEDALLGLDGFSHIQVFWWFHKNDTPQKRRILRVHPRGNRDNPLTGVFATRAPVRPNLIALTTCKILSIDGRRIHIESIDAFDATPVIDIKPYARAIDEAKNIRVPDWVRRK